MTDGEPEDVLDLEREVITLSAVLKVHFGISGGEAKALIQGGEVRVDGQVETRRARKLRGGEVVELADEPPVRLRAAR